MAIVKLKKSSSPQSIIPGQKPLTFDKKVKKVLSKMWKDRLIYLMILPIVIYYAIFRYLPMAWLSISFYDYKILRGISGSRFVGFQNFRTFFDNPDFMKLIYNTLILNIYSLAFCFTAPIIFALLLNEIRARKFKRAIQTISYLPHFLSMVVVVGMIYILLSPTMGSINTFIKSMGFKAVNFLQEPQYFRSIYIISGMWQGIGWGSIVYLSAITSIDQEMYEAAMVDGATRFKQVWHITIPSLQNTIIIMLILQIGSLMSVGFEKVYLLQQPTNISVSEVLSTYVYKLGIGNGNYSLATAVGLFNSVISLTLVLFSNYISKKYSETSVI
jgi:putative aldouronate transport system permease protein